MAIDMKCVPVLGWCESRVGGGLNHGGNDASSWRRNTSLF